MLLVTHAIIGITGGMVVRDLFDLSLSDILWAPLLLGSLAPDIDEPTSTVARVGTLFSRVLPRPIVALANAISTIGSHLIKLLFGHRGFTHWPIVVLALSLLSCFLESVWLLFFSVGYGLHLLADFSTKQGLQVLAPLSFQFYHWSPLRTGGRGEIGIRVLCGVYMLFWGRQFI
jgi:inner membrane protein